MFHKYLWKEYKIKEEKESYSPKVFALQPLYLPQSEVMQGLPLVSVHCPSLRIQLCSPLLFAWVCLSLGRTASAPTHVCLKNPLCGSICLLGISVHLSSYVYLTQFTMDKPITSLHLCYKALLLPESHTRPLTHSIMKDSNLGLSYLSNTAQIPSSDKGLKLHQTTLP